MMDILQCDSCENQSPNKNRNYIANNWCKVKIESPWRKWNRYADDKFYIICDECLPFKKGHDPETQTVIGFIKKFFKMG